MLSIKKIVDKIDELFDGQARLILDLISPAIGIRMQNQSTREAWPKLVDDAFIQSKIGGMPDIGEDFIWPEINNLPLTFLGQINLTKASMFNPDLQLRGILYFFVANCKSEDYSELINNIKIIYLENVNPKDLLGYKASEQDSGYPVEFYQHYTLPSYQEKIIRNNNIYSTVLDEMDELEWYISELTYGEKDFTRHHMLGDPNAVQGSVRMFWGAAVVKPEDIYYEKINEYMDSAEEIGDEFVLLLQIDLCDKRISLPNYGDNCLYFGIHKDDLKCKNFNKTKLVIQST
ncbi:DUF1963 domain-containing protein [Pedobacter terrae]|uniref:DUF1963 domain-containing protein n=1 Tax=Pedobacter terrae TaxID=405671 RepID=UPI002FFD1017